MKFARMHKSRFSRMDKIAKNHAKPAPGDYNTVDAFNKT